MSKRTREINAGYEAARQEQQEMARQERAEKKAARDTAAKADRLTRDALRPQVWISPDYQ